MKRSRSWGLREFGRMLWKASLENRQRLIGLLTQTDPYVVLPTHVSNHYTFMIDELVPVSGAAFDRRFIAQQIASLREAVNARTGEDLDLKEFCDERAAH